MNRPVIDHRGTEFAKLAGDVLESLRTLFQTSGPVVMYPASGTGAWEAAIVNTLSPGDRVLMFETGHFSQLWRQLAEKFGIKVEYVPGTWRRGADPAEIEARLGSDPQHTFKAVMVVHNETSTGVTSRISEIRRAMNLVGHPALLIVDTISSLACVDYRHEQWEVDVTVAGSQKGLMLPPGLSFNAISEKRFPPVKQQSCPDLIGTGKRCWLPIAQAFFRLHQPRISSMGCERPLRCYKKRACQMCLIGIIVTPKRRGSPCKRGG